jgi:hypothetical protein
MISSSTQPITEGSVDYFRESTEVTIHAHLVPKLRMHMNNAMPRANPNVLVLEHREHLPFNVFLVLWFI